MTTVELSHQLDLLRMGVDLKRNNYTEEELKVIRFVGRIVRNLELLEEILLD